MFAQQQVPPPVDAANGLLPPEFIQDTFNKVIVFGYKFAYRNHMGRAINLGYMIKVIDLMTNTPAVKKPLINNHINYVLSEIGKATEKIDTMMRQASATVTALIELLKTRKLNEYNLLEMNYTETYKHLQEVETHQQNALRMLTLAQAVVQLP